MVREICCYRMERPRSDRFVTHSLKVVRVSQKEDQEEWFKSCTSFDVPEDQQLERLRGESVDNGTTMKTAFEESLKIKKIVSGLSRAECVAVLMYTLEYPPYYKQFNKDCFSGQWKNHKVFSALLVSACVKLAKNDPVKQKLYRGTDCHLESLGSTAFFWPQFSSSSLKEAEALKFANSTVLEFSSCRYGAKIKQLSAFPNEEEVLILPFEAFVNTQIKSPKMYFTSCDDQPLMSQTESSWCMLQWVGEWPTHQFFQPDVAYII